MTVWGTVATVAAGLNLLLLAVLTAVWARNYRQHGAAHTLGLVVFGAFLVLENAVWVVLYTLVPDFYGWMDVTTPEVQMGVAALCGLELVAVLFLARITLA